MDLPEADDEESLDLSKSDKAQINKDDAASSFGEKDSNTPGNRPYDQTSHTETETVLNDAPSSGPGPISKSVTMTRAELSAVINKAVNTALRASKTATASSTIAKSAGPGINGAASSMDSKVDKSVEYKSLVKTASGLSFSELNRKRAELGELPTGIL